MSRLELFLLGAFRLAVDGQPVDTGSRKSLAILAYLGATGRRSSSETLATLIWPETDPVRSFAKLRRSLWHLKRTPVGDFIAAEQGTIQLQPVENTWVDSVELEKRLSTWGALSDPTLSPERVDLLREATALYRGEFLTDLHFPDNSEFEKWAETQRERLRRDILGALDTLAAYYLDHGDNEAAQDMARQQLDIDSLREGAYRQLMTALARSGQRDAALAHYLRLHQLLADELRIEPSTETTTLYQQIHAETSRPAKRQPDQAREKARARPMPVFLFTDIESSTPLWDRHRGTMLEALRQHNAILAEQIERHEGRILESRGDGVKAVFEGGQPLQAALAIQQAFGMADWGEVGDLRIRLGLHGVHVEWEGYDYFREGDVFFGPVLNYAARVMDAAWGGQIMVSENVKDTFMLPEGASWQAFGRHDLKGCEEPIRLYGLLHPGLPHVRFPPPRTLTTAESTGEEMKATAQAPRSPFPEEEMEAADLPAVFVARNRELIRLVKALNSARARNGQILFVIGGPGRGKTMLVQEFARRGQESDDELIVISGNCNAHTGVGDPYLPFREALMMLTGDVEGLWAGGRITSRHARRLWELMPITLPVLVEEAPDLIGTFVPDMALLERAATFASQDDPWFKRLTAMVVEQKTNLQQRRLFTQCTTLLKAIARKRPILLILEDLHWVDASSSDLLFHMSREVGDGAILIVGTYRPEEIAPSGGPERHPMADVVSELKRRHGDIWLDLGAQAELEGRQFVTAYLQTEPNRLTESFGEALYQHTEGHALFTVELLRDMQERGDLQPDKDGYWVTARAIDWEVFPAKVEGVIERRVGRLPKDLQAVLRVACVEGESFTAEVVARVQAMDERDLVLRLSRELDKQHRLVTAQALERLGTQRLSLYRFRHHLFQHYLYHNLDETERAYLHEEVGKVLESLCGEQKERFAVQLARHFERAGLTEKAITYLHLSGVKATLHSANLEAIRHLTRGLNLLKNLPITPDRDKQELALQVALGVALQTTRGLAAPEAEEAYSRARELCQSVGEASQLFRALWGLWLYYSVRSAHQTADELGRKLWALAKQEQDPTLLLLAHRALGSSQFWVGDFSAAREHLQTVIENYRAHLHHSLSASYGGSDVKVHCLCFSSPLVCWLGYPERALELSRESLSLSRDLSHTYSLVAASMFASWLRVSQRDMVTAQELAENTIDLATEVGSLFWLACGVILKGCALSALGRLEEGIVQIRQGLSDYQATGARVFRPFALVQLAGFLAKAGQVEEGLAVLDDALATVEETDERFWEAELHRLRGELLLTQDAAGAEGEDCLLRAIDVARHQEAKLLELRATVSLSRLWQAQGRSAEAHQILEGSYSWFTEGFETADLKEAQALLEELTEKAK